MGGGPCTRLQSHLSVFLETTSVAVDEFQPLVLAFAAVLQVQMAYCGALPCPDTSDTLPTDDLIGINSHAIDGPRVGFTRRRRVTMISRCCNPSLDRCESSAQALTASDVPRRSPAPRLSYAVITSNRWPLRSLK